MGHGIHTNSSWKLGSRAPNTFSMHDHRLRLLPAVYYCEFSIMLNRYLQPQHNAVNPLAVLSLLRPRLILLFLHISPVAEQRRASARRGEAPFVFCILVCMLYCLRPIYHKIRSSYPHIMSYVGIASNERSVLKHTWYETACSFARYIATYVRAEYLTVYPWALLSKAEKLPGLKE